MQPIDGAGFLPGISFNNGGLIIDTGQLKYPGDILYAAGRLAVMPPDVRLAMKDDLEIDDMQQSGGVMALAWVYAVCMHLGLDPHVGFHAGYKTNPEELIAHFSQAPQWGIPMLQWCGMTYDSRNAAQLNKLPYPHMERWCAKVKNAMQVIRYAKLPVTYDVDSIQAELQQAGAAWQSHLNTYHYTGSWTVLSLRSPGGRSDNPVPDLLGDDKEFKDTAHMSDFPSVKQLLSGLDCLYMLPAF